MNRRSLLLGIGAAIAAPAVVRADSIMKIAVLRDSVAPRITKAMLREFMDSAYATPITMTAAWNWYTTYLDALEAAT